MCMDDLRIAARLATRDAVYDATISRWVLLANPIRHSIVIPVFDTLIRVYTPFADGERFVYYFDSKFYDGIGATVIPQTQILRTMDFGQVLTGRIEIDIGDSAFQKTPWETYPTSDIAGAVAERPKV